MRRHTLVSYLILLGLSPLLCLARPSEITLCEDPWPPYTVGQTDQPPSGGIAVEIARELFRRIPDVKLNMILLPWKRCLLHVEQGRTDGMIIAIKSSERPYVAYPDPIFENRISLFYKKARFPKGFDWESLSDFQGYKIGILGGTETGKQFRKAWQDYQLKVEEVTEVTTNFRKLNAGRIDFILSNQLVGWKTIQQIGEKTEDFSETTKPFRSAEYFMPLSIVTEAHTLIPEINKIYKVMKEEGIIERMMLENL